ncbi:MAG: dockerin type I domain-containing protein, partial [bacterium]
EQLMKRRGLMADPFSLAIKDPDWGVITSVEGISGYNAECTPRLTADGKIMVFAVAAINGPGIGHGIFMATWNDSTGSWNEPTSLAPNVAGSRPFISPDGSALYYARMNDIWMSQWDGAGWTPGVPMDEPINSAYGETEPAISFDGQRFYFSSDRPGGFGGDDIWVAKWNGAAWDSVTNLGHTINTEYHEGWPFETADGMQLYFGSWNRPGFGFADIWVSHRDESGWDPAMNLGPPINTDLPACSPFVTADGKKFYCGSEANEGSLGDEDIWIAYLDSVPAPQDIPPSEGWVKTGELPEALFVYSLVQASDGALYAGTYPNGDVFKSTDGGETWINTGQLLEESRVYALLEAADGTIYAGTYPHGDVFRTTNGGASWQLTTNIPGATAVRCLYQAEDGSILAGVAPGDGHDGRIFKTTDGGVSWQLLGPVPGNQSAIYTILETDDGALYAGGMHPQTVARSTDGGLTWSETAPMPIAGSGGSVNCLIQTSDGAIYTGGWRHGEGGYVFKTTDGGATWTTTGDIVIGEAHAVRIYTLLEASDGTLYAGFQPGPDSVVYKSTDKGETWISSGGLSGARETLCLLQASDGTIYAGTTPNGNVFKLSALKKGDVNGDGTVDVTDVVMCVNIILGLYEPTPDQFWRADYNEDGQVNVLDVVGIVNEVLGG